MFLQLTFLGVSTFFSIAPHPPLPPSYLVFPLSFLFHPSTLPSCPFIHPPTNPSIHPSIWVSERTDGWMDDWMHGLANVGVGCFLVVAWTYGRLIHARGPSANRLTGF